ncbi:uncharacterized protein LOC118204359 [Stegodyphus dumicola]|uniref:uncharacterized protein LOC118204359 n=1 Tax=Stegodyphus dumicola TaxID=202533 RepID=UPI0015AEA787|nr:uncharacterized protein LOC118204359 [Stegodyphus dumicola]
MSISRFPPNFRHSIFNLSFLQCNLQKSRASTDHFMQVFLEGDFDFAFLQEFYSLHNSIAGLPLQLSFYQSDSGLSALVFSSSFPLQLFFHSQYFVTALFSTDTATFLLTSVYVPPNDDLTHLFRDLDLMFSRCRPGYRHIILGDFNASHSLWGARDCTPRGTQLVDFFTFHHLVVLNTSDSLPTFLTSRSQGWIDLSLVSASLSPLIQNWQVRSDLVSLSDHQYITFNFADTISFSSVTRFKTLGVNPQPFISRFAPSAQYFTHQFSSCASIGDLDLIYSNFIQSIYLESLSSFKFKRSPRFRQSPWWNSSLQLLRRRVRALRRRAQSAVDPSIRNSRFLEYRRLQAICSLATNSPILFKIFAL